MLSNLLLIVAMLVGILLWINAFRQKLVKLNENVGQAMKQIGVQLSSRFEILAILLRLAQHYAPYESDMLLEEMNTRRKVITAKSTPEDVLLQEKVIAEVIDGLNGLMMQHAELKDYDTFQRMMDAVQVYENMLKTSQLLYNDCVKKLNKEIQTFPYSLIAKLLGFSRKAHLSLEN